MNRDVQKNNPKTEFRLTIGSGVYGHIKKRSERIAASLIVSQTWIDFLFCYSNNLKKRMGITEEQCSC